MATIQVVIDAPLLKAANRAAKRAKVNRSALMREALREHLHRAEIAAAEKAEVEAYRKLPQTREELAWSAESVWPED
jgi:metal-responsive CopG/Arc/MetJ family transcriptional regulator